MPRLLKTLPRSRWIQEAPLFEGPQGRAQTALLIASIASFESFFRFDVDSGKVQGDHGKSWCLMQVQVHGKTAEGWRGTDLVGDRQKCLKAGLHIMRGSFQWCRGLKLIDRLAGYTTGTCKEEPYAQQRMRRALVWWKDHPSRLTSRPRQLRWPSQACRMQPRRRVDRFRNF